MEMCSNKYKQGLKIKHLQNNAALCHRRNIIFKTNTNQINSLWKSDEPTTVPDCRVRTKIFKTTSSGTNNIPKYFNTTSPSFLQVKLNARAKRAKRAQQTVVMRQRRKPTRSGGKILGSFSKDDGDGNENVHKSNRLNSQINNSTRALNSLVHIFAVTARQGRKIS